MLLIGGLFWCAQRENTTAKLSVHIVSVFSASWANITMH